MNIIPDRKRSRKQITPKRYISKVSRALKYDGTAHLTRIANATADYNANTGFSIGASAYQEFILTFSPLGVTIWGSNINYFFNSLPNVGELSALYDRIKIDKVEILFSPCVTDNGSAAAQGFVAPRLYIANDINGPTSGSTVDTTGIRQLTSCKVFNGTSDAKDIKWTCYPSYQRLIQYTSLASSFEPARGFVASDTDIPHYGVRVACAPTNVGAFKMNMNFKFFLSLKNVK